MSNKKTKSILEPLSFNRYIVKVLKEVSPDTEITGNAVNQLNSLLSTIAEKISLKSNLLTLHANKKTINTRAVNNAVLLLFSKISSSLISPGIKAVIAFASSRKKKGTKMSQSKLSNLIFPVARVKNIMKKYSLNGIRISQNSSIFLTAVLEQITAKILEQSAAISRDDKKTRITPRHLLLSMHNDEELLSILKCFNWSITGGGVLPNIHK